MSVGMIASRLALLVGMVVALAGPAAAQYRQEDAGSVGNGRILRIFEGNRFNRCAAEFANGASNLRLAFTFERKYTLSVPAPTQRVLGLLTMTVDVRNASFGHDAQTDGQRAWMVANKEVVQALLNYNGPWVVFLGPQRLQWPVSVPMAQVFRAVEDCTNRAVGWR